MYTVREMFEEGRGSETPTQNTHTIEVELWALKKSNPHMVGGGGLERARLSADEEGTWGYIR
jgi:hypothetical protein